MMTCRMNANGTVTHGKMINAKLVHGRLAYKQKINTFSNMLMLCYLIG